MSDERNLDEVEPKATSVVPSAAQVSGVIGKAQLGLRRGAQVDEVHLSVADLGRCDRPVGEVDGLDLTILDGSADDLVERDRREGASGE